MLVPKCSIFLWPNFDEKKKRRVFTTKKRKKSNKNNRRKVYITDQKKKWKPKIHLQSKIFKKSLNTKKKVKAAHGEEKKEEEKDKIKVTNV